MLSGSCDGAGDVWNIDIVRLLDDSIRRGVAEMAGTLIVSFGMVGKSAVVKPLSLEEMADHYRKQGI